LDPLTTYYSDDTPTAHVSVVFSFSKADSNTSCNYFGQEYYVDVDDENEKPFEKSIAVALTTFPGYMGAKEGDNQFLSLAGANSEYAPGNVQVGKDGKTALVFRDAKCFGDTCDSKSVMRMVRFPEPLEQILGKKYSELGAQLSVSLEEEQTGYTITHLECMVYTYMYCSGKYEVPYLYVRLCGYNCTPRH
jgi:hypothetical protein